jgi:hypothetical protein
MKHITYTLQFRGHVAEVEGGLRKLSHAPGCSLVTRVASAALEARYVWEQQGEEAVFESAVAFAAGARFTEEGTIHLSPRSAVRVRGAGRLGPSPDPELLHGTAVYDVVEGAGQFEGAHGRITSNFLLSDTGELTENQLGVVFLALGMSPARAAPPAGDHRLVAPRCGPEPRRS